MWGVFIFAYLYAVIGGDLRQELLLKSLAEEEQNSCIRFAVNGDGIEAKNISQAVSQAKNLLLPIPMCKGNRLNIQQGDYEITKEEMLSLLQPEQRIFAGCIDKEWARAAEEKKAVCYDYMEEKSIAIYNAIATAEGTLAEIISTYPENLHGSKIMILGFGICAKALAKRLQALSAKVCIAARSETALMEAYADGYQTIELSRLTDVLMDYPVVVNTIPARVIGEKELPYMDKKVKIYEIASYPYGVDMNMVVKLGIWTRICPSLPAKYAPESSVKMLRQYIMKKQKGD